MAPLGVDSSDLWRLNLSEPSPMWQNITHLCSGDLPRPLSGSRMQFDPLGNQLVLMGGYSCTTDYASGLGGGSTCFSNNVWLMSLAEPTMHQWTALVDPNPGPSSTWPSARAWHSTILYGQQLWVFGGQYQDASATVYFLNDVQVFDLAQRAWQTVGVKGATPPVMWSQTSNLVLSPDDGIWHMVVIGGCSQSDYYSDVYILKLNTAVTADNCEVSGAGMTSTIAGEAASFFIQTRVALNISNSSILSSTGERAGHNVLFGDILTYGVQLNFDVLVIAQVAGISTQVQSSIEEVGNGLYNVTYLAYGGVSTSCGNGSQPAEVTVSITLDGQYLPYTPFNVPVLPSAFVAAKTSVSGVTDAVQGKSAYLTIQPADAYGNVAQGALNASLLVVEVDAQPLPLTAVSASTAGVYQVEYLAPSQARYSLSVMLDGEAVSGSPFSISPLANMDISSSEETGMRVLAGLASGSLLVAMLFLYSTRSLPKVKAASPLFLFLILAGCQLALVAVLLPVPQQPSTSSSSCGAYAYTLSVGFTLAVSSLVVKTWRIARIFDRRKIKVRVITDRTLLIPVALLVAADVILNGIWLGVDPLLPSDSVSSSNALLHYTVCSSKDTLLWYSLMFVPKGLLLAYGVVLASQVRNVPSAFNESKWIGLAVYNIAFCSIILLAILLLLTSSPASVYVIRSIGVIWCVLVTGGLMLLPKLQSHTLVEPTAPSSSEHKVASSAELTSTTGLKGYESSHSTARSLKPNAQPATAVNALEFSGFPLRAAWQKSARAASSTPTSTKAPHRTIVNSAEFKWEPATGTAKPLSRDEPALPSLSMAVVPLHSPRSRRTAPSDAEAKARAATATELSEADRVIAQLRAQVSALSAVVDALTLATPIPTEHGLALVSHSIYATVAHSRSACVVTPPFASVPTVDESGSGRKDEHDAQATTAPAWTSSLSDSSQPLLPAPHYPGDGTAATQSDGAAAATASSQPLSNLLEDAARRLTNGRNQPLSASHDEWSSYEAAVLSRLTKAEQHSAGTSGESTTAATASTQPSGACPPLSALLAHPVCVALLKVELSSLQSVHLLLFALHCRRYRLLQTAQLRRLVGGRIRDCFLSPSAAHRVELSDGQLSTVLAALQHSDERLCSAELFDGAVCEVGSLMERRLMPRLLEPNNGTMRRCATLMQTVPWHWPSH